MQLLATLVTHHHRHLRTDCGQCLRHATVEGACALAAAQHQQAQRTAAISQPLFRRRDGGDFSAHRVAHELLACSEGSRETRQQAARVARQDAVGQARRAVLFVHDQRQAVQARGHAAGAGSEATEGDHRTRLAVTDDQAGGTQRAHQTPRRSQQGQLALATQTGDGQRIDVDVVLRNQTGFHCASGAHPGDRHATRAQHAGHGQAREDMPAGTTGQDHHRPGVVLDGAHPSLPKVGSTRDCRRLVPRTAAGSAAAGSAAIGTFFATGAAEASAAAGPATSSAAPMRTAWRRSARFSS
ncbi:hypothetical protein D3C73_1064500 [compost metagenome]